MPCILVTGLTKLCVIGGCQTLSYLLATKVTLLPGAAQMLINRLILDNNETMVLECNVREFIFDGVNISHITPIERLVEILNIKLPDEIRDGKFAVYMGVSA